MSDDYDNDDAPDDGWVDDTPLRPLKSDSDWAAARYEEWVNARRFRSG